MNDTRSTIARLEATVEQGGAGAAVYYELGGLKLAGGDSGGAISAYERCLALAPSDASAHNNLGSAYMTAGRFEEAIRAFETALMYRPSYERPRANLGKALREVGRVTEAIARVHEILALKPDYLPALVNLGDALVASGDFDQAISVLLRAALLAPTASEAKISLAYALAHADRTEEAIHILRGVMALAPEHAACRVALASLLFLAGAWREAWSHFEYRLLDRTRPIVLHPPKGATRWDGSLSADLELWLIGEQGLGDQLQFVRYAGLLEERGVRCVVCCDPRLVSILSLPRRVTRVVPYGTPTDSTETRWIPLMDLPRWHGTEITTVPGANGYLAADPKRISAWRDRLSKMTGPRVGLVWAGNRRAETGLFFGRSPQLPALRPLLATPGVNFISLQKDPDQAELLREPFNSIITLPELDAGSDAFLDTAAVLRCVDLLVTSDTSVAHLAGALGVPTWLCLKHFPDWRWMFRGTNTPWYHSLRLFRQPAPADWSGLYADVAVHLGLWSRQLLGR